MNDKFDNMEESISYGDTRMTFFGLVIKLKSDYHSDIKPPIFFFISAGCRPWKWSER